MCAKELIRRSLLVLGLLALSGCWRSYGEGVQRSCEPGAEREGYQCSEGGGWACDPTTCQGCCDGELCRAELEDSACGSESGECVDCLADGMICQDGRCATTGPCEDGCEEEGLQRCQAGEGVEALETCEDANLDGCLEWTPLRSCNEGRRCDEERARCVCPHTCDAANGEVECLQGSDGSWSTKSCLVTDGGCPAWGEPVACAEGETCDLDRGGCTSLPCDDCQLDSTNNCSPGLRSTMTCGDGGDGDDCPDLIEDVACLPDFEYCLDGVCVPCGEPRCSGRDGFCSDSVHNACEVNTETGCLEVTATAECGVGYYCLPARGCMECPATACTPGTTCRDARTAEICTEFGNGCTHSEPWDCLDGEHCEQGVGCVTCPDSGGCEEGEPDRCTDDGRLEHCDVDSATGCGSWAPLDCSRGEVCGDEDGDGDSECYCPVDCSSGETRCLDGEWQTCVLNAASACPSWGPATLCEAGDNCRPGERCDGEVTECLSNYEMIFCVPNEEGCLEWSESVPCQTPCVAVSELASCILECDAECVRVGQSSCAFDVGGGELNATQTCRLDPDQDPPCLVWDEPVPCDDWTLCIAGECL